MSAFMWESREINVAEFNDQPLSTPFSPEILCFTKAFSETLLCCNKSLYPDLVALGYWCRPKNISLMQSDFMARNQGYICRPKGSVFQVTPGNVDTLFLYSGLLSLLMGNRTAIRISQRQTEQLIHLLSLLEGLLQKKEHQHIARRFLIFSGEHNSDLISSISKTCDIRVIWGGDSSIKSIRKVPLSPHAKEISFADRHSICLMNADAVCRSDELSLLAANFYRDVLTYSQQACSSPKALIWHGCMKDVEKAMSVFWSAMNEQLSNKPYRLGAAEVINRLTAMQAIAISQNSTISDDNIAIARLQVDHISEGSLGYHTGYGMLFETQCEEISMFAEQIIPKFQTLTYFGYDRSDLLQMLNIECLMGVDRICLVGEALNFDSVWDGYDLLQEFCSVLKD